MRTEVIYEPFRITCHGYLELLAQSAESLTVSQIAKILDIPKSSAFDILGSLLQKGFVRTEDPKAKTYALGLSTYRMGMAYMSRMDLYTAAHRSLEALLAELSATRQRGYALDLGEDNTLLRCIAVPVRNSEGNCIAAISVSMLAATFEKEDPEALAQILTATALEVSHRLGYSGSTLYQQGELP